MAFPSFAAAMRIYTPRGERLYINEDERRRFLDAAQRSDRAIRTFCLTLTYTGCRISEVLALTPMSVQLQAGVIAAPTLKKRTHDIIIREIPVPADFLETIELVHGIREAQRRPATTGSAPLWNFNRRTGWKYVKAVMAEAQIEGPQATPKGLRHGFGVHAIRCGVPLNMVQKWMGHADISTTAIYGNAVGEEEQAIAARMWG